MSIDVEPVRVVPSSGTVWGFPNLGEMAEKAAEKIKKAAKAVAEKSEKAAIAVKNAAHHAAASAAGNGKCGHKGCLCFTPAGKCWVNDDWKPKLSLLQATEASRSSIFHNRVVVRRYLDYNPVVKYRVVVQCCYGGSRRSEIYP